MRLAGDHRKRAHTEYHLAEHWTATEWLDLCATWDFLCPICLSSKPLTPHHRIDMSKGGHNTIADILPVCAYCHSWVKWIDCRVGWLDWQRALRDTFKVGDVVLDNVYSYSDRPSVYTIVEIFPPVPMDDSLIDTKWGGHDAQYGGVHIEGGIVTHWENAWFRADHGYAVDPPGYGYNLDAIVIYTQEAWKTFQAARLEAQKGRNERYAMRRAAWDRRIARMKERGEDCSHEGFQKRREERWEKRRLKGL